MLTFIRKHKLLSFIVVIAVIYVIQFFLFPNYFPQYYPRSNEAWSVLFIPLIILVIVGNVIFDISIGVWTIVDVIYGIMLCIYHGRGLYGIGMEGITLDGNYPTYSFELAAITILIFVLFLFTFQFIIRILCLIIKKETKS